jgi:type II secretory pathway component PulJ
MRSQLRRKFRGTTLIEVIAGLVILSTLLVSVAMARGRFLRQWSDADRRIQVTQSVDHLLSRWLSAPPSALPISGQGNLEDAPNFIWRTRPMNDPAAGHFGAITVRLEAFDSRFQGPAIVTVDFLVHDIRLDKASTQPSRAK